MSALIRLLGVVILLVTSFQLRAESKDFCELYPITLPDSLVGASPANNEFEQVRLGNGHGNYSWLTWTGRNDTNTLAHSLIPPGDSDTFVDPYDASDVLIDEGDWVQGAPGVKNGRKVRDNLDVLIGKDIIIPLWSSSEGQGSQFNYLVHRFATIQITGYKLGGKGWMSFVYKGYTSCYNEPPIAEDKSYQTPEDTNLELTAVASDVDGDPLTYKVMQSTQFGTLSGSGPSFTYTPNNNFTGQDSFTFKANDGEEDSNVATVTITVTPVNDAPTAEEQTIELDEDTSVEVVLTGADADGDQISFQVLTQPSSGQLEGSAPNLVYTPEVNFNGEDSFTFITNDGDLGSEVATVSLLVRPTNDAPKAHDGSVETREEVAVNFSLEATDIDGDDLTYSLVTPPQHGTVELNGTDVRYVPEAAFFGNDQLTFKVNDGSLDSNIATVNINILEKNKAPTIVSTPTLSSLEGSPYVYDVDAEDPNTWDVLSYSLNNAPPQASIDAGSGTIQWTPSDSYAGNNALDNTYCALSKELDMNTSPVSDVTVVIDESGSMSGEHDWVAELIPLLEAHLRSNEIGDGSDVNNYGLVGYGDSKVVPRQVNVGSGAMGTAEDFITASNSLRTSGGKEDGWAGLKFALGYPLRDGSSRNMILVTDEDRDNTDDTLTFESIKADLESENVILNVAVNAKFECEDGSAALGLGQNKVGFVADGSGGFEICQNAHVKSDAGTTDKDYIDLALSLGGAAWDLNVLRSGGINAQSFSSAFVEIKVQEIKRQFEAIPQADVAVIDAKYFDKTVTATIKNRSALNIDSPIQVSILDGAETITTLTISSLAGGEEKALTYSLVKELSSELKVTATIQDTTVNECSVENNSLKAVKFDTLVTDTGGLTDNQIFAISVQDTNDAPTITSTPSTSASVDVFYNYKVAANDPDIGDGLIYSLSQSPVGMTIDELSGSIDFKPNSSQSGQHEITVNVDDLSGASDSQTYTLVVDGSYIAPKFVSEPIVRAIQGTEYSYQTQTQKDDTATLSYRLFRGPEGISFSQDAGLLTWSVPDNIKGQKLPVILQVQDQLGNYDIQAFDLIGDIPPVAPQLSKQNLPTANLDSNYGRTFSASDSNTVDSLSWEMLEGPDNSSIESSSGIFRWTPASTTYPGSRADFDPYCVASDSPLNNLELNTKWVSGNKYINQPLVAPMYDSNQDGLLNNDDRKVIIGITTSRYVVALDALTGKELWRRKDVNGNRYNAGAIVNLDNDTNAEFVFVQESSRKLVALNSDGSTRWVSQDEVADVSYSSYHYNAVYPTDIDDDGEVELLFGPSVFSSKGERLWNFSMPSETYSQAARGNSLAVDIDADGSKEVFYYDEVRDSAGNLLWKMPSGTSRTVRFSYFAYGNFDSDAEPEIVVNEYSTRGYWLKLVDNDGSLLWEKKIPRVGVLNLADFNNDGSLEIYSASSDALYDSDGTEIWSNGSSSSYFGASVADVDADGYLDILRYRTDQYLYIYQGSNGLLSRKVKTGYASQTPQGSPLFIDIDNDGQGEVITSGVQVQAFESNNNSWLSASSSYNHLQQSLGGFTENGKPTSALLSYYGQTAEKASTELESRRKYDLAITHAEVYPSGSRYRVEVSLTNKGTANYDASGVIRLYANTVDDSNKIADITIPELAINKSFTGYHYIDDHQTWGEHLIAKVVDTAGSECSAENSIASAETIRVSVTDSDNLSDELSWAIAVQEREQVPTFTTSPVTTAVVGSLYTYTAQATDTNRGDKVRYFLGNSPSGVTLNSVTGEVQWTPKEHQAGRHNIQINAIDLSGKQRTQSYNVTVSSAASNNAPVITSDAVTVASVGYSYYYNMIAEDLDADILSYSLESAPAGMTINALSGELYWTPTESDIGSIEVIAKVTDESGASDTQTFNLTVRTNAPPVINSTPEQIVVSGSTYVYDVNASDADGDDITYELITAPAGMNINQVTGVVQWSTVNVIRDEYAVKVRASDTFGSYSEQSFGITVTEQSGSNNPPSITSMPSGNAVFDTLYSYDVNATDTDGDNLSYLLELSPSGMTINTASGLIEWTPTSAQDGSHDIIVRVEDGRGGYATQSYAVYVSDGSTSNALPVITSTPGTTAKATFEYSYQIVASDADGDALEYSLTDYPQGMTLSSNGLLQWTPQSEQTTPVKVRVRVSDGKGYVEQGWTLNVVTADTAMSAEITSTPKYVDDGETVSIQVTPVNAVDPVTVSLKVDDTEVPVNDSYQAEVVATGIGTHTLEATVSDKYETITVTSNFIVKDPNDTDEPALAIHSPVTADTVSAPTDVVISVNDSSLANWRLVYKEKGSAPDEFVTLAEGTENITEQSVATFDPTMLQNGQYAIVLEATDSNGFTSQENVVVAVEGDLKVGNFSITFEDVNIPVAGIPITVTRTYDTRQKHKDLDFGQGWSVGYQNVRVHESRTVGLGWNLNEYSSGLFSNWCVEPNGDPVVSVTLPNGRIEKFVAKASPHCQQIVPQTDVNIVFEPMAGTTSTISQSSFGLVRLYNGNIVDLGEPDKPIDPDHYKLTTADGFVYSLDQNFGVRNVSEPTGHSLTFTKDGVVHSGGKGISFVRDIDGNITTIDLPDGTQIKYEYDANGDLVAHRDQLDNKTEFTYNNSHGLLDIIDPRGVRVTRNEYDDSGRLIAQIDPDGNRIEFTHDIDSRLEVIKDRRGNTQVFTYDEMGNVLTEQNGAGETITRTYDEHQNVLSKTDDLGNTVSWTYDDRRNQLTETDALGNVTEYTYNSLNKPLTEKGPDDNILVTNAYKTNGQLTSSTNAVGGKTDFVYATSGLSSISDSLGCSGQVKLATGL